MTKTVLPLILAALLAIPAYAFDSSDPFGMGNAQADKPAKAQREKNDGHFLEDMAKNFGTGVGVGAAGGAVMGAAVLNPLFIVGGSVLIGTKLMDNKFAKDNAFYSGSLVRAKVSKLVDLEGQTIESFGKLSWNTARISPKDGYGFDLSTFPSDKSFTTNLSVVYLDTDDHTGAYVFALIHKEAGIHEGDIVDIAYPVGVFFFNTKLSDNLRFDFNKHMPRVVNVYCKHDNPACQNDYESSLGVMSRPNITEFPPSQYLIDPAIIADDQAKMRKEEAERKAATSSGGFNLM